LANWLSSTAATPPWPFDSRYTRFSITGATWAIILTDEIDRIYLWPNAADKIKQLLYVLTDLRTIKAE
jgi:hypothetical protein